MTGRPSDSPPDPRGLARMLAGEENELSRAARTLAERREGDLAAWLGLVERAAVALRRAARDLEHGPLPPRPVSPTPAAAWPTPSPPRKIQAPQRAAPRAIPPQGAAPPLASVDGVVSGHASVVPVSDLLAFISGLRRSGMLWVETEREGFLVQLQEGSVVYAQGDNPPRTQMLGEILVEAGLLARDALEQALQAAAREHEVLGAWLTRTGQLSPEDLTRALATQVQLIFDRMFTAPDARWRFEDGVRMVDSADVRLNVIQLLLESARASDESHCRAALELGLPLAPAR